MNSQGVYNWLLDSDPSIRWQVLRDLTRDAESTINTERSRVDKEGWGSRLLKQQRADGAWGDGQQAPLWQSTLEAVVLLRTLGIDPNCAPVQEALRKLRDTFTWGPEFGDLSFFDGEVEPCINGRVLMTGAYFGFPSETLLTRLLSEQLADGGWNCEAERGSVRSSFHTTICVLEGLLEFEKVVGVRPEISSARLKGEEYLVSRQMYRRLSTGRAVQDRKGDHDWTKFSFPCTWHYDVLRGLEYLRRSGADPDMAKDAIEIVRSSRGSDGRWCLERSYFDPLSFSCGDEVGKPSRWLTLIALRVLDWAEQREVG